MTTATTMTTARVLLIKDASRGRHAIKQVLESEGYMTDVAESVRAALRAFGYLAQPFEAAELIALVRRAINRNATHIARADNAVYRRMTAPAGLVGDSPPMRQLYQHMHYVAGSRASVLVTGETGTGKELVARGIHELSPRAAKPFVPVNCSAWPETLLESELFGHVRGSFTGAFANRRGVFEEADGGTLFLDEISTIPPSVQVKLLRVLQEREIRRLGAERSHSVDFRLIAATNVDLAHEIAAGRFREDLFYRLNVFPIHVPPLRARRGDIPKLVEHFYRQFAGENNLRMRPIPTDTMTRLQANEWPGNVRQLQNVIERIVVMPAGYEVPVAPSDEASEGERALLKRAHQQHWNLARLEREYILKVLLFTEGRRTVTAEILGVDRRTLYCKLKEYGIDDPSEEQRG
ncbi:MAG: sigma-54 dependent transcriptional regulator [Gemmatimonadota bacterium]